MNSREETHVMDPRDPRRGNAEARFCGCDLRHPSLAAHDEAIVAARLASVKALADEWADGPYLDLRGAAITLRAVLGSDAHTGGAEQHTTQEADK